MLPSRQFPARSTSPPIFHLPESHIKIVSVYHQEQAARVSATQKSGADWVIWEIFAL